MISTLKEKYKNVYQLNDTTFNIDSIQDYDLTILASPSQFKVCIIDKNTKRCLMLEDYFIQRQNSLTSLLDIIDELINRHTFLNAAFWHKKRVIIDVPLFTLVPKPYFSEVDVKKYLLPIGDVPKTNEVRYDYITDIDAYLVYSMPSQLVFFFQSKYGANTVYLHKITPILSELLTVNHKLGYKNMYVVADKRKMYVGIFEQKKLFLFNVFSYNDEITFIKIVLRIFKIYRLNQENSHIGLWCDIDSTSKIFETLKKYVKNVTIEKYSTDLIFMEDTHLVKSYYMEIFNSFNLL